MMLRKVFGPNKEELREGWKKFHNDELRALKFSPNIQAIKQGVRDGQGMLYVHKRRNSVGEFISCLPTARPDVSFSDKVHVIMRDRRIKYFSSWSPHHCAVWLIATSVSKLHSPFEQFTTISSSDIHQKMCFFFNLKKNICFGNKRAMLNNVSTVCG
jgi:hypothetical protein